MKHRVVIYRAAQWAADEELLAAVETASGMPAASMTTLLQTRTAVFIEQLDEAAAADLARLAEARGIEFDVEPMKPDGEKLEWLLSEIPKWVKRGVLHPLSVAAIHRNYGLEPPPAVQRAEEKPRDSGLLIRAILTIGAVLVGLGLILFIASNWQHIPSVVKIGGSLLLTLAALHAGYHLRFVRDSHPRIAGALLMIAVFGIGGVVTLIAQVYHLQADTYLLPLVWGGLCVPLALFLRFKPALYLASALWLWAYWLHAVSHGELPWFYPLLLLGFLLPHSWLTRDRYLFYTHVATLMLALLSTVGTKDLWIASVWVAALVVVRWREPKQLFDWLLAAGLLVWHLVFLLKFEELPNFFYLLPLAYFFYRCLKQKWNLLMIATIVNSLVWLLSLFWQLTGRFDLADASATGVLLWALATGLLGFGAGQRVRDSGDWKALSFFLRYGGPAVAGFALFILSFRFYAEEASFFSSPLFLWSTVAFGAGGLLLAVPALGSSAASGRARSGALLLVLLVALGLVLAVVTEPGLGVQVTVFNLTLFAAALVLMLRGHRTRRLLWYNAGIALFVVLIVSRYFDTFVDLLPRSVFFLLGGVFLIVWGVLVDRQRRRRAGAGEGAGA